MSTGLPRLRLCENMRTIVYAPFYYALETGAFRAQGLEIELVTAPSTPLTAAMLLDGRVDVSWGGPMRVLLNHEADPACPLVSFTQVVARDPFILLGRTPRPDFRFTDLEGLRVAVATDVPTPWFTFQDDLGRAGIDPARLIRTPDRPMSDNVAAFLAGEADVVQVFEPYADDLVQAGRGHIWHRFSTRGDIGYTTFYTTRRYLDAERPACAALTAGMGTAQAQFYAADAAAVATAIASYFPDYAHDRLARVIDGYRGASLWARTPSLPIAAFLRLKAAMISAGAVSRDIAYEHVVWTGT